MKPLLRKAYLEAMGIQSWIPRSAVSSELKVDSGEAGVAVEPSAGSVMPAKGHISQEVIRPSRQAPSISMAESPPAWLDDIPLPDDEYAPSTIPDELTNESNGSLSDDGIGQLSWEQLASRVAQCTACELHKTRTQTVFGVGLQTAKLMVIGEAPGADEDRKGEPFVGRAGKLLTAMLGAIGLERDQVYIANILKCRPPGNRDPRAEESLRCEAYLQRQIALVNPQVIMAFGAVAAHNLLQSDEPVGRLRAKSHQLKGIPVVVSYHPAYLLRSPEQKAKAWLDLQRAARLIS
jgi:uracil-DNA glycosylase family 4